MTADFVILSLYKKGKKSTIFRFHNPFSVILSPCFKIYTTMLKFHKQKAIKSGGKRRYKPKDKETR